VARARRREGGREGEVGPKEEMRVCCSWGLRRREEGREEEEEEEESQAWRARRKAATS
jgi:hypothetical protein